MLRNQWNGRGELEWGNFIEVLPVSIEDQTGEESRKLVVGHGLKATIFRCIGEQ